LEKLNSEEQIQTFFDGLKAGGRLPMDVTLEQFYRVLKVRASNRIARSRYKGKAYPGDALLVTSTLPEGSDPSMEWNQLIARKLEIYCIPGHHGECIELPGVIELAAILKKAMLTSRKEGEEVAVAV
jgi:hypothetical protein